MTDLIQAHRRRLVVMMQHFTGLKADADPSDLGLLLVVDAEIFRLDAVIRWLDGADARLRGVGPREFPAVSETAPPQHGRRQGVGR